MRATTEAASSYSLRRRLTVAILAGFSMVIGFIAVALWNYAASAADRTFDLLLEASAITILGKVSSNANGISVDFPPAALEMLGLSGEDRVFYRIFRADGETLTGDADLPDPDEGPGRSAAVYFDAHFTGVPVRFLRQGKLVAGPVGSDQVFVQVGHTRTARNEHRNTLFFQGIAVLGLLAIFAIVVVRLSINLALKPLSWIVADIETRDSSDLTKLRASPPREIASLISAINGFMFRLGASNDNAQTFIADVAHQLRTSLSTLKGQLELAGELGNPDDMRDRIAIASRQARNTVDLTNQLLAHAMVIHRADKQMQSDVDLVELVTEAIEEHIRRNQDTGIEFELVRDDPGSSHVVPGDAISLREALRNLIDNVEKHTGENPVLRCSIGRRTLSGESGIMLVVEDNGPGIDTAHHDTVLERFSRRGDTAGSGLGLAIVKAVMDAHSGSIRLAESELGGLRVELFFPDRWEKRNAF